MANYILGALSLFSGLQKGDASERNGEIAMQRARQQAHYTRQKGQRKLAAGRVAIAKSGFVPTGSVVDALVQMAGDIEEDAQNRLTEGRQNQQSYNAQASNSRTSGLFSAVEHFLA